MGSEREEMEEAALWARVIADLEELQRREGLPRRHTVIGVALGFCRLGASPVGKEVIYEYPAGRKGDWRNWHSDTGAVD